MPPDGNLLFEPVAKTEFIIHFQDETHGWRYHSGSASHHYERDLAEYTSVPRLMFPTVFVARRIDVVGLRDRMPGHHTTIQRACGGSRQ